MIFYLPMVNAWSLLYDTLNGTLDEEYPIVKEVQPKINTSFPKSKQEMYKRLLKESETTFVPTATLLRNYAEVGMEITDDNGSWVGIGKEVDEEYTPVSNHQFKYHEEEILKDIEEYISSTYNGHYTGTQHEFRKVQTIDLMASRDLAPEFCQANILKYGSRYGSKNGKDKKDLLKVIHYAMLLLHFDNHYGQPSMTSGNIDHTMP